MLIYIQTKNVTFIWYLTVKQKDEDQGFQGQIWFPSLLLPMV